MRRSTCIIVSMVLLVTLILLAAPAGPQGATAMAAYELAGSASNQTDPDAIGYSGWLAIAGVLLLVGVPAATIHMVRRRREKDASHAATTRRVPAGKA